jgi:hypothetical protein
MNSASHLVKEFFETYERSGNALDLHLIASHYADSFMFAERRNDEFHHAMLRASGRRRSRG